MELVKRFWLEEAGTEIAEWVLVLVIMAVAILVGGPTLQTAAQNGYQALANSINGTVGQFG